MNFIIVMWAFCLATLVYSIVGITNPRMFKFGLATVAPPVPSVFMGAGLGALFIIFGRSGIEPATMPRHGRW